ncbi:putative 3-hydroxyisobutyryl-CoA hydrolase [Helianthus annuus]|uniref:3-hydroxyisobutyryl-CoA hydrolase n=1 Tax=Helianthus annuus TaxID=4232 RepID=A0A9K3ENE7_HELAN|nr:3-hydroxyisobutyryl-CoA hydrolase 1 isoform X1 [Helianthus annuus]XP_021996860.1 3-hydroxyisobutyryl-CoA hydrolase 1 isoform X1 [Helianthus annuus]KAF5776585.1 putative 3-hydroxyisobutyryl-CoA hydrolase [Helianthus annuus]KAJ0488261.1 putative 3-hydroxyisobutyryl-CoA hydrolase [Helianthus annuus]KAJ0504098.1 putative 3-hydroxyisobutyryl-CoA hydrolase [Helianthus annuus]KAJ0673787.1 putative 3-hydroxyisobutyryl-CoA hydrolase [Helianthus annuus]KAJ0861439.1 putative 3-hydroxyisobutyryl-CoA h
MALKDEAREVIFEEIGGARKVILNRSKKLNTLNYEMLRKMYEKLKAYENDPIVKLVILKANGKVFCAGGDLTSAYTFVALGHWSFGASYYRKEFCLNYLLATYKKPSLAILDGHVMGGGVGISIHSTFRIVTENTVFAMPEVLIGLFPDVGASYFLSRLPGFFGEYVGLTGARLNGVDMLAFGLGTHFIPSKSIISMENSLEKMIASSDSPSVATMSMIINEFAQEVNVKRDSAYSRLDMVNQCFCGESCEEILRSLECLALQTQDKWVHEAITSMKSANPIGLKIFLKTIREGRSKNIKQCLETEYVGISHLLGRTISNNFYEGSRAMLIDKDKKPQWLPSKLEDVSDEMVAKCLSRSFSDDDDWLPLQLPSRSSRTEVLTSKL